jgi:hypothetical protein
MREREEVKKPKLAAQKKKTNLKFPTSVTSAMLSSFSWPPCTVCSYVPPLPPPPQCAIVGTGARANGKDKH